MRLKKLYSELKLIDKVIIAESNFISFAKEHNKKYDQDFTTDIKIYENKRKNYLSRKKTLMKLIELEHKNKD